MLNNLFFFLKQVKDAKLDTDIAITEYQLKTILTLLSDYEENGDIVQSSYPVLLLYL